jgi:Ala-tRNA(Pro) deacylase
MTQVAKRVREFLDGGGVRYELIHHQVDYTAEEAAEHSHTPGRAFAKAVIVRAGADYVMAVLPAHHVVDLERLSAALDHRTVELATEGEVSQLCPDCETGAIPPFGNLYQLPVCISPALAEQDEITVVGGGHADVIRLPYRDFASLVKPRVVDLSQPRRRESPAAAPERG